MFMTIVLFKESLFKCNKLFNIYMQNDETVVPHHL